MKAVTIKITESLESDLRRRAKRRNETLSELARRALQREAEIDAPDFAALAAPYRGMFQGPADLSVREGFGN
jgi:predicted transcriptional regulator